MAWNVVLENIVTDVELTAAINALKSNDVDGLAALSNEIDTKLNVTGGTANGLLLTNVGGGTTAAISRQELNDAVDTINAAIALKASLAGATFSGTVIVPDGSANNHAVNFGQLNTMLPLAGGTVTGNITCATSPSTGSHLTNKTYVDSRDALKADITYVDSEISNLLTDGEPVKEALDLKAPLDSPTFTGVVQATVTIGLGDSSSKLATTQWVQTELDSQLASLASINSPTFTGTPALTTAPDLSDDSTKLASTAWVRDYVASVMGP